jgi:hypothetical protein
VSAFSPCNGEKVELPSSRVDQDEEFSGSEARKGWLLRRSGLAAAHGAWSAVPDVTPFAIFFAASLLLAVTPGPGMFYVAARTQSGGDSPPFSKRLSPGDWD